MKKEILDEIDRLLGNLEQDPHLPSNKEVDNEVKRVLEHLKGFVGKRRENGKGDSLDAPKIVSEDFEKEYEQYVANDPVYSKLMNGIVGKAIARHFAEWQKGQMMKDAVKGEIGYRNQRGLSILLDKSLEKLGYDDDTKVKIIIIKDKED